MSNIKIRKNEKKISEFLDYVKKSDIDSVKVNIREDCLIIRSSLLTFRTFIDCCLIAVAIYATYTIDNLSFYLIPILFGYLVVLFKIWIDFAGINIVLIDYGGQTIKIKNRNIVRYFILNILYKKKYCFKLGEIRSIEVRSNESFREADKNYFIDAKTIDDKRLILLAFSKEKVAQTFAHFLNNLIFT